MLLSIKIGFLLFNKIFSQHILQVMIVNPAFLSPICLALDPIIAENLKKIA